MAIDSSTYGDAALTVVQLGSGGGSSGAQSERQSGRGGTGGGAISITAARIIITGVINADGTEGASVLNNPPNYRGGGGGSGGSVRLRAPEVVISGQVTAAGGPGGYGYSDIGSHLASGGAGGFGRIRIESVADGLWTTTPPYSYGALPAP